MRLQAVVAVAASALIQHVAAIGCTVADKSTNLYIFGAPYGDINLGGSSSSWTSATAPSNPAFLTNLANRPAFDTANPSCHYNPYTDTFVVINGDKSKGLSALHLFNHDSQTWLQVPITGTQPNADDLVATLDHDTSVIYAYSQGALWRVGDAGDVNINKAGSGNLSLNWLTNLAVTAQPFDGTSYKATFGQGTNHLHFFNAPGLKPGEAWIFVVHYAWWQPTPQSYGSFPQAPGQSVYVPLAAGTAPPVFAYIPDDGQNTYLVDTKSNTTTSLAGFGKGGPTFRYAATAENLIQFDTTTGNVNVLPVGGGAVTMGTGLALLPNAVVPSPSSSSVTAVRTVSATAPASSVSVATFGSNATIAASKTSASEVNGLASAIGMWIVGLLAL
ncbi:hypothetical protein BC830DRAFT_1145496 [Chytriomyces sp. MP71]|nr:hypothetical protein BC830DRAFT_1145496 [Chytriomyces sp. MP71]